MHPSIHAASDPSEPALIFGDGRTLTYKELDQESNRIAHFFRHEGLLPSDAVSIFLGNSPIYLSLAWACQRAGLYAVPISSLLRSAELAYILSDSDSRMLISSPTLRGVVEQANALGSNVKSFWLDEGRGSFEQAIAKMPSTPIVDQCAGSDLVYSSGTTGRPKGVRTRISGGPIDEPTRMAINLRERFRVGKGSVYLSPAPLYHAAPLRWVMTVHRLGGTAVVTERFDPETVLRLIEKYRVTHAQFVPTHFSRLLQLPEKVRAKYDVSSLQAVIHAAAPCPATVKDAMIEWFGPIVHEYYAGSEGNGITMITSQEWLTHRGSVGRAVGCEVKICGDDGEPLAVRSEGTVFFAGGASFEYHKDAEKTAASRNRYGWSTLGDVGYLDEEGFLYLTDRRSFMIISGGVNVYPQEIENELLAHPKVLDAAVVGSPHPDLGEQVTAVIQTVDWGDAGNALAVELRDFLADRLSGVKVPRRFGFMKELPRLPTGKLLKRVIHDAYQGKNPEILSLIVPADTHDR